MRYETPKFDRNEIISNVEAEKRTIEALDSFSTPIPGQSLTMRPGSQAFEKPWVYTDPDECLVFLTEKLEQDRQLKEEHLSLLASGVPVEYIVNTTAFAGFTEGLWSPDVAELIKPGLAMYYILVAMDENIPFMLFNPEGRREGKLNDNQIMDSMKNLHPEAYNVITERMSAANRSPEDADGFLDMPEGQEVLRDAENMEDMKSAEDVIDDILIDEKEGMI